MDTSLENPRLKPCPFCEAEPTFRETPPVLSNSPHSYYQVRCDDSCGMRGPRFYQHRHLAVQGSNKMARRKPCS